MKATYKSLVAEAVQILADALTDHDGSPSDRDPQTLGQLYELFDGPKFREANDEDPMQDAAIEMQASHSAAADAVPVAQEILQAVASAPTYHEEEMAVDRCVWRCSRTRNGHSDDCVVLKAQAALDHPSPTTAPAFEPESERTDLSAAILNLLYKDAQRGFSVERVHAAIMGLINSATAPATTTPAAIESIDNEEFRDALRVYAENHGKTGEGAARYEVVQVVEEWHAAHTAAQVAAKQAEAVAPEFCFDPDGELCMDWTVGSARLSLSFGGAGKVSWAMLDGGSKACGSKEFGKPAAASGEALNGWKYVPRLSTGEMVAAAYGLDTRTMIWEAMYDAAPQHQVQVGGDAPSRSTALAMAKEYDKRREGGAYSMVDAMLAAFAIYAATPSPESAAKPVDGVRWDLFPGYLIDHCEGDTITEEGLQFALARMLKDADYLTAASQATAPAATTPAKETKGQFHIAVAVEGEHAHISIMQKIGSTSHFIYSQRHTKGDTKSSFNAVEQVPLEAGLEHLKKGLDAVKTGTVIHEKLAEITKNSDRFLWCTPLLTGEDTPEAEAKTLMLGNALMENYDGVEAIDTAMFRWKEKGGA